MMPFTKRYRWSLLLLLICVAGAGWARYWAMQQPAGPIQFSRRQYDCIYNGMSESQLRAVFGVPPGDYGQRTGVKFQAIADDFSLPSNFEKIAKTTWVRWASDTAKIGVRLDDGIVGYREFCVPVFSGE